MRLPQPLLELALIAIFAIAPTTASPAVASPSVPDQLPADIRRALPDSPSGGYAPKAVNCPSTRPTARSAASLSQAEQDWLLLRRNATVQPLKDLLKRNAIAGFDAEAYITRAAANISALPNVAIAVSGGGYRALLNGAGFI